MKIISEYAPYSYILAGVIIFLIVLLAVIISSANQKKREKQEIAEAKRRDEELNAAIENKSVPSKYIVHERQQRSFDDIRNADDAEKTSDSFKLLKILVKTSGGTAKYLLDEKSDIVRLGRESGCDICIMDNQVSRNHCDIYRSEHHYFVRDLESKAGTILIRGKNNIDVDGEGAQLQDGDILYLGNTKIDIVIM